MALLRPIESTANPTLGKWEITACNAGVLSGEITVTFRLWRRPKVKIGGRYRVGSAQIEVDSIELVPFASIDEADLLLTGEPDLASLRQRAAHAGPISAETLLYRIEFHVVR